MSLLHEFGVRVSATSVLKVMRRMGLHCRIRARNPWKHYSSYRGDTGGHVSNLLKRNFTAGTPFEKLGTDVTEFKVAATKAYLAPVYDMGSKEIIAWDISRHPDLAQQQRLLAMLEAQIPHDAHPILHSDMGWQYQHRWWRQRLKALGIRQSMSREGQLFGQRGHRTGVRPSQGRVLHGTQVRFVRRVQTGTRRLYRALEHQTPTTTTQRPHPHRIPRNDPHHLRMYSYKPSPTIGVQFTSPPITFTQINRTSPNIMNLHYSGPTIGVQFKAPTGL